MLSQIRTLLPPRLRVTEWRTLIVSEILSDNRYDWYSHPQTLMMSLGAIHIWRPQNCGIFWHPLPVHIWYWSTELNSRNLPYYIFFWANPPPPPQCGRHKWMPPKATCTFVRETQRSFWLFILLTIIPPKILWYSNGFFLRLREPFIVDIAT